MDAVARVGCIVDVDSLSGVDEAVHVVTGFRGTGSEVAAMMEDVSAVCDVGNTTVVCLSPVAFVVEDVVEVGVGGVEVEDLDEETEMVEGLSDV